MKKILALLITIPLVAPLAMFAQEPIVIEPTETYQVSQEWHYDGYSVERINIPEGLAQIKLADNMQKNGFLPLADENLQLYLFDLETKTVKQTSLLLPWSRQCAGCSTSISGRPAAIAEVTQEGEIVVLQNEVWMLFNPSTFVLNPVVLPNDDYTYRVYVGADGLLYAFTGETNFPGKIDPKIHRATFQVFTDEDPIEVEELETSYARQNYSKAPNDPEVNYDWIKSNKDPQSPKFSFIGQTDYTQKSDLHIGMIQKGIYVARGETLTKIGYSNESIYGYLGSISFKTKSPLGVGDNSVVWIGGDSNLYLATLDLENLPNHGAFDIPIRTPFKSNSDSTVYYNTGTPSGTVRFMSANDYFKFTKEIFRIKKRDTNFEFVLSFPEEIVKKFFGKSDKENVTPWTF